MSYQYTHIETKMHTNPCSLCTHFCSIGVKFTRASDVWCRCFWRRDYDTVKNSELPWRHCFSANMADRLLIWNRGLEVQNVSMWEILVSMHIWVYSCITWKSTLALLKHAFQKPMDIHSVQHNVYIWLVWVVVVCDRSLCLFQCFGERFFLWVSCLRNVRFESWQNRESVWLDTLGGIKSVKCV